MDVNLLVQTVAIYALPVLFAITLHEAAHALLAELDAPMLSATLTVAGDEAPLADAEEIRARLESALDVIVDGGPCGVEPSTVIDLTKAEPQVVRVGRGSLALTPPLLHV